MLDTSYGFNNLLKEVTRLFIFRVISTFQVLRKWSSGTLTPVRKLVPKSKDHLDLMVTINAYRHMPIYLLFIPIHILALKKMVVNHIDKTFVTSDAATILK